MTSGEGQFSARSCLTVEGSIRGRDDANVPTVLIVFDRTFHKGKQREILALSNATAGMKAIAYLRTRILPGTNALSTKALDTAALAVGVASVAAGTLTFFMCHAGKLPMDSVWK